MVVAAATATTTASSFALERGARLCEEEPHRTTTIDLDLDTGLNTHHHAPQGLQATKLLLGGIPVVYEHHQHHYYSAPQLEQWPLR